mmetsp:Transcript_3051/g.6574  ORF Transcript_3051/g.6574 Transcript_3051/m.6574 type:complete len:205 (+) Transcript_3051:752-1366(+)
MIVPVGIPASTLEDPSKGSKTATYLLVSVKMASFSVLTRSTGTSSSSEAKTPMRPVNRRARLRTSLVMTSSFFWSSPWMLISPWYPKVSLDGNCDRLTMLVMALQAVSIAPKRVVSSVNSGLSMATSFMYRFKVTPVVSHTSSKTGTLTLVSVATLRAVGTDTDCCRATKALETPAKETIARAEIENFMVESIIIYYLVYVKMI